MNFLKKLWDYFFSFKGKMTEGEFLLHLLDPIFFIALIVGFSISFIVWAPTFEGLKTFDLSLSFLLFAGGLILLLALFTMNLLSIFIRLSKTDMTLSWLYYRVKELISRRP